MRHVLARSVQLAMSAAVLLGCPAASLAWTQAYVVEWLEPANYYDPFEKDAISAEAPGRDCPRGVTPDPDYPKKLIDVGHKPESVQKLYDPEVRNAPGFDRSIFAKRGRKGENVYTEPWTAIEYPYPQVQGKLAYGFDLDHDPRTGFTGVDGTPGVDNALYKVSGCIGYYRGRPRDGGGSKYANESMHNGAFTVLLVLQGDEDPLNDRAATLSFKSSPDELVRDAAGGIARDYSFRVNRTNSESESTIPVTIQDGVIRTAQDTKLVLPTRLGRRGGPSLPLVLHQGQLRLQLKKDGALEGLLGGYQVWEPIWRARANYIVEVVAKVDSPSFWYALRRHADGVPDPKTKQMTAISAAYSIWAVPAFEVSDAIHAADAAQGASE
jgi:hypothetical protein